jgi:DNA-binding transcriptional ArsR family regulator
MMTTKHLTECPLMQGMSPEALAEVAAYFQTLSEPTRLAILNLLREGERSVGEIAELTGYTAANVSRHLAQLAQRGFIARTSRGTSAYYKIADDSVYALCDLVCGNIARQYEKKAQERNAFVRSAQRAAPAKGGRRPK